MRIRQYEGSFQRFLARALKREDLDAGQREFADQYVSRIEPWFPKDPPYEEALIEFIRSHRPAVVKGALQLYREWRKTPGAHRRLRSEMGCAGTDPNYGKQGCGCGVHEAPAEDAYDFDAPLFGGDQPVRMNGKIYTVARTVKRFDAKIPLFDSDGAFVGRYPWGVLERLGI